MSTAFRKVGLRQHVHAVCKVSRLIVTPLTEDMALFVGTIMPLYRESDRKLIVDNVVMFGDDQAFTTVQLCDAWDVVLISVSQESQKRQLIIKLTTTMPYTDLFKLAV